MDIKMMRNPAIIDMPNLSKILSTKKKSESIRTFVLRNGEIMLKFISKKVSYTFMYGIVRGYLNDALLIKVGTWREIVINKNNSIDGKKIYLSRKELCELTGLKRTEIMKFYKSMESELEEHTWFESINRRIQRVFDDFAVSYIIQNLKKYKIESLIQ